MSYEHVHVEKVGWHKSKPVGTDSNAATEHTRGRDVCTRRVSILPQMHGARTTAVVIVPVTFPPTADVVDFLKHFPSTNIPAITATSVSWIVVYIPTLMTN